MPEGVRERAGTVQSDMGRAVKVDLSFTHARLHGEVHEMEACRGLVDI
jgi:hypothetical protein